MKIWKMFETATVETEILKKKSISNKFKGQWRISEGSVDDIS